MNALSSRRHLSNFFLEKVDTYALSNIKDGGDLKPLFIKMEDPAIKLARKGKPVKPTPTTDDKGNTVEVDAVDLHTYKEEVKMFVSRK